MCRKKVVCNRVIQQLVGRHQHTDKHVPPLQLRFVISFNIIGGLGCCLVKEGAEHLFHSSKYNFFLQSIKLLHFVHFKQFTTNSALWGIRHLKPPVTAKTSNCNKCIRAMAILGTLKILKNLLNIQIPFSFFFPKRLYLWSKLNINLQKKWRLILE